MNAEPNKVAIVTDSVTCLTPEMVDRYRIVVVPVNIVFNGRVYRDGIDLTSDEAFRMLKNDKVRFASSSASIGEYLGAYQQAAGYAANILCVTITSKLSTMYNVANIAREQAKSIMPDVSIEVIDPQSAAIGEGLLVSALARAAGQGKNLNELIQTALELRGRIRLAGAMKTVRYVYRTGRIPRISARLGSLANIKPVFGIWGGELRVSGVSLSLDNAVNRILEDMRKNVKGRPAHVAVAHADALEAGQKLKEKIESEFDCAESWLTAFSPVISYAAGPGVLAVAYYSD